jgi:hypothetical protein
MNFIIGYFNDKGEQTFPGEECGKELLRLLTDIEAGRDSLVWPGCNLTYLIKASTSYHVAFYGV